MPTYARGKLAGAALDHFVGENPSVDHPLCSVPNVVLTPHIGGATCDSETRHSEAVAHGLAEVFAGGRPANLCNPEALDA
jgi:D-3-phosphoglycerate dehydrogenase